MATIDNEYDVDCSCDSHCPTSATVTEWSCGCVSVVIHDASIPCSGCSDFSGMRSACGKSGHPGG